MLNYIFEMSLPEHPSRAIVFASRDFVEFIKVHLICYEVT